MVGSFFPWAQAGIFSFAGTRGVITLVLGVIVGVIGFLTPTRWGGIAAAMLSGFCLFVVGNIFSNFTDSPGNIGAGVLVAGLGEWPG